jgi:hypothetical protein
MSAEDAQAYAEAALNASRPNWRQAGNAPVGARPAEARRLTDYERGYAGLHGDAS